MGARISCFGGGKHALGNTDKSGDAKGDASAVDHTVIERVISRFSDTDAEAMPAARHPRGADTGAGSGNGSPATASTTATPSASPQKQKQPMPASAKQQQREPQQLPADGGAKVQTKGALSGVLEGMGGRPLSLTRQESPFYVIRKTKAVTDDYVIGEELGKGQFGVVTVAVCKRTRKRYAMKSISKRKAESDPNFRKDIRTEVEIMYHLGGHPNIIQLYDVYEDADTINLILELCEGGDWFQRLLAHGTYSEVQAAATTRTILETLSYCHSLGVVHRDIKPENVLLADRTDKTTIKLADFGLSAMVPQAALIDPESKAGNAKALLYDAVGTAYYVAPEVLMARVYGKEVDIWSLGVVLYIVLGGYAPFDGAGEQQILNAIVYQPLRFDDPTWNEISNSAKDLISRMLCKDPRKRATIPELLDHPWVNMGNPNPGKASKSEKGLGNRRKATVVPDAVITRLQNFAAMNRFKKEARKVLATFLPEEEVVGLLRIFKEMDTNNDGVLTLAELRNALSCKGVKIGETTAKALLNRVDINDDEVIDYQEFLAATVHQLRLDKDELLYKAFQRFDRDKTGFISREDLQEALAHVQGGKLDLDAILKAVDTDCDGRINYEEFCNYLCEVDTFDEEVDRLTSSPSGRRTFGYSPSSGGRTSNPMQASPRPLLNSMSSRRRDPERTSRLRESRGREQPEPAPVLKPAISLRSSMRRRENTSDPGEREDVGNKSVRFRETVEVSAVSVTNPRDKHSGYGRQLAPLPYNLSQSSNGSSMGRAPWEREPLQPAASTGLRSSMKSSIRSKSRNARYAGDANDNSVAAAARRAVAYRDSQDHTSEEEQYAAQRGRSPAPPTAGKPPGAGSPGAAARHMHVDVSERRRSMRRSRSRGKPGPTKSPSGRRGRDLIRDASVRDHPTPHSPRNLQATPSSAAAAAAAAIARGSPGGGLGGGTRTMGRPLSSKGRPVTLPNSASSRNLSRDGSRSHYSKGSKSSRSPSPSDRDTDHFAADGHDLNSLRMHTLPANQEPVLSPSLLEFRRHSCISPQAPDLTSSPPPKPQHPNRSKTAAVKTAEVVQSAAVAAGPKAKASAWS